MDCYIIVFLLKIVNKQKRREIHKSFWQENIMEGGHLEHFGLKAMYTKMDLKKIGWKMLNGFR